MSIGADQNGDESNLTGFMSELRITRGVGRYNVNGPQVTAPFPIGYQ